MPNRAKFRRVAELLRERIESGEYVAGIPLPTEPVLAKEFEVNRLTLRKALKLLADRQLLIRRPGSGTFVNPAAAPGVLPTVLYVGETGSHFYQGFYQALCAEAQKRGKAIIAASVSSAEGGQVKLIELADKHRRLICMEEQWAAIESVIPEEVHVTRVSGFYSAGPLSANERPGYIISTDLYRAAKLAVEHLVGLGHRRIGLLEIGWPRPDEAWRGTVDPRRESVLGFRAGLQEAGLKDDWLIGIPDLLDLQDWQEHEAQSLRGHFEAWTALPSAIVCAYEFRAAPLIKVLRQRRLRVPRDVSLVGIGNTPWAEWTDPQLTSLCLGEAEMARLALVLNEEPEPPRTRVIYVAPELVVRKSTGPAANPGKAE